MSARWAIAGFTFALAMVMLFARLGHNALWDDESYTALAGVGVWNTGDTTAVIGQNIVAFRNGELLKNLRDRSSPPLPAYVAAPFVGVGGRSALAARLPFAICGAVLITGALGWVVRRTDGIVPLILAALTLLGAVSMFLYFRQCRYYGLTLLAMPMLSHAYLRSAPRTRVIPMLIWSLVLLASNYITFAAAIGCVTVDYLFFGRRDRRLSPREIAGILLPVILLGVPVVWIWDPLGVDPQHFSSEHPIHDRLVLVWWFFRDFARGEFAATTLLIAGVAIGWWKRDRLLLRGILAIAIFIIIGALLSPQSIRFTFFGDVRYVAAIIPVALAVQWRVLMDIASLNRIVAIALAAVAVASNALTLSPLLGEPWRSTTLSYVRELIHPPTEPYSPTAAWINAHVSAGESIWVLPESMTYPLMFHAPAPVYAWQLPPKSEAAAQFQDLPPIHFMYALPPDWMIAFGPAFDRVQKLQPPPGIKYQLVHEENIYWRDLYRPEIFGRSFEQTPIDPREHDAIYIFKRVGGNQ